MKFANVSVLMSVYYREDENSLHEALNSMINQTYTPRQFVIVKDGKLDASLDLEISLFFEKYNNLIDVNIVELEKRVNLGVALNAGLSTCKYSLVARMDSDDHALPERIEKQTEFFLNNRDVKVLGGMIQEFTEVWNNPVSYREVPVGPKEIQSFSRKRNPLNHMTVMFQRDFIQDVMKGYRDVPGFEDYDLWLRVLKKQNDAIANLPEILVAARTNGLQSRRGGLEYIKKNAKARIYFLKDNLISLNDFFLTLVVGTVMGLASNRFRGLLYRLILRRTS